MNAEQVRRIRMQAQDALDDLSPSGILGWSAMTLCVRAVNLIDSLAEGSAAESEPELRALATELSELESTLRNEQQVDALEAALGRISLMARVAAEALQADGD